MAQDLKPKKHSKGFFVRLFSGTSLAVIAIATTLSVMIPSYVQWKNYYDHIMAEKAEKARLEALPLVLIGISAELDKKVKYYDNDTAEPEKTDFVVRANFTEKGSAFSKKLSADDFSMTVPEDFSKKGGTIKFSYIYTPEKKDGEVEDPKPIEKTTELTLTLIEPDETVFKVMKEPTFTEEGYAENIKGTRKVLPILNTTDYEYLEKMSIGVAVFTHKESGIIIKKAITNKFNIIDAENKRKEYNNINCHFANDIDGLKIIYNEGKFIFNTKDNKIVSFGSIDAKETSIEFQTGEYTINGSINAKTLVIKSHVKVNLNGKIESSNMIAEKDSEFNITCTSSNNIIIAEYGSLKLYGKAKFIGSGGNTAIELNGGATLSLTSDSRIVGENFYFFIGTFSANKDGLKKGYFCIPADCTQDNGSYYLGENCILDLSRCENKYFCNIETKKVSDKYIIVTAPDTVNPGVAQDPDGNNVTLPTLNFSDYNVEIVDKKFVFTHTVTKLFIELSFDKVSELKVDGLTINYSESTGYKFSVDENKEINLTGKLSIESFIISGKGKLSITGELKVSKLLLVESGSTLKVNASKKSDAIIMENGGKAELYGTVVVNAADGQTGICFTSAKSALYLSNTSRVTVSGGTFTIGYFYTNENVKIYYPKTATLANNKITSSENNILLSYGSICKIVFEAVE